MDNELRIIVAGSRDFNDFNLLSKNLTEYLSEKVEANIIYSPNQVEFISGTARGADTLGEKYAYIYGYKVKRFPANWDLYGKRAGYIRNEQMAKYSVENKRYGILFAFWDGKSRGTKHMIDLAKRYGLEVHVVNYKGEIK